MEVECYLMFHPGQLVVKIPMPMKFRYRAVSTQCGVGKPMGHDSFYQYALIVVNPIAGTRIAF